MANGQWLVHSRSCPQGLTSDSSEPLNFECIKGGPQGLTSDSSEPLNFECIKGVSPLKPASHDRKAAVMKDQMNQIVMRRLMRPRRQIKAADRSSILSYPTYLHCGHGKAPCQYPMIWLVLFRVGRNALGAAWRAGLLSLQNDKESVAESLMLSVWLCPILVIYILFTAWQPFIVAVRISKSEINLSLPAYQPSRGQAGDDSATVYTLMRGDGSPCSYGTVYTFPEGSILQFPSKLESSPETRSKVCGQTSQCPFDDGFAPPLGPSIYAYILSQMWENKSPYTSLWSTHVIRSLESSLWLRVSIVML
ncbi:hypothetical protein B0H11DRAFT_1918009 [Mycena galericulata]|nr:hypothetical protein B0H11DRAFT_1918009 [Mycena galericulata]